MRALKKMNATTSGNRPDTIVFAACETVSEARAIVQYALPVLQEWPESCWSAWVTDSVDCISAKAAWVRSTAGELQWQRVDTSEFLGNKSVCEILGGKPGIVVLACRKLANSLSAIFQGLVADHRSLGLDEPAASVFRKPFLQTNCSVTI